MCDPGLTGTGARRQHRASIGRTPCRTYGGRHVLEWLEPMPSTSRRPLAAVPDAGAMDPIRRGVGDLRGLPERSSPARLRRRLGPGDRRIEPSSQVDAHRHGESGDLDCAMAGDVVTLVLTDAIDVARGDVLADPSDRHRHRPDRARPHLDARAAVRQRRYLYLMKIGTGTAAATVAATEHNSSTSNTLSRLPAERADAERDRRVRRSSDRDADRVRRLHREPPDRRLLASFDRYSAQQSRPARRVRVRRSIDRGSLRAADGRDRRGARRAEAPAPRRSSGSPACRARASRRSRTSWKRSSRARHPHHVLDGDMCVTASTATSASPRPTASRTSDASREVARLMTEAGLVVLVALHLTVPRPSGGWCASCSPGSFSRSSSTRRSAMHRARSQGPLPRARCGRAPELHRRRPALRSAGHPELHLLAGRDDAEALAGQVFDRLVQLGSSEGPIW